MPDPSVFPPTAPPARTVAPGLYLVATPIGNLRDMTLRALDVLAAADLVLAEDTRVTGKLLSAYGLKAKLERCDDHASARAAELAIERLKRRGGGGPGVGRGHARWSSDPGFVVARAVIWPRACRSTPSPAPPAFWPPCVSRACLRTASHSPASCRRSLEPAALPWKSCAPPDRRWSSSKAGRAWPTAWPTWPPCSAPAPPPSPAN